MYTKILVLGIVVVTVSAFAACSDDSSTGGNGDSGVQDDSGGPPPTGGTCVDVCTADDDCGRTLVCNAQQRCACDTDERCQAQAFDSEGCTNNDDCSSGLAPFCVKWAGSTFCSADDTLTIGCGANRAEKVTLDLADDSGTISRCMVPSIKCDTETGECIVGCGSDSDCTNEFGRPTCDMATARCVCEKSPTDTCTEQRGDLQCLDDGTCGCLTDEYCDFDPLGNTCNTTTGQCECDTVDDCEGSFDACIDNHCRCTSNATCGVGGNYPGTTLQCL